MEKHKAISRIWWNTACFAKVEEKVIEQKAAQGWILFDISRKRFLGCHQRFRQEKPRPIRAGIVQMPVNSERYSDYLKLAAEAGWTYIGNNGKDATIFITDDTEAKALPAPPKDETMTVIQKQLKAIILKTIFMVAIGIATIYGILSDPAVMVPNQGNLHLVILLLLSLSLWNFFYELRLTHQTWKNIQKNMEPKTLPVRPYRTFKILCVLCLVGFLFYWTNGINKSIERTVIEEAELPKHYAQHVVLTEDLVDKTVLKERYAVGKTLLTKESVCVLQKFDEQGRAYSYYTRFRSEWLCDLWIFLRLNKQKKNINSSDTLFYFPPNRKKQKELILFTDEKPDSLAIAVQSGPCIWFYRTINNPQHPGLKSVEPIFLSKIEKGGHDR